MQLLLYIAATARAVIACDGLQTLLGDLFIAIVRIFVRRPKQVHPFIQDQSTAGSAKSLP